MNLTDSAVQMILFGDAILTNQVDVLDTPLPTLIATNIAGYPVNLRDGAGTNYDAIGTMDEDGTLTVDGRNAAGDWFRVQIDDGIAWVYTSLVTLDGDANSLAVLDSPYTAPMQQVTLSTVTDDTLCDSLTSGLLLQSSGDTIVQISVNGVDLAFSDATLLLHTNPSETLNIQVIEGTAIVTSQNTELEITSGELATVILDDNLLATTPPSIEGSYSFATLTDTPTDLLEQDLTVCIAGITYETEAVSIYAGPSDEYAVVQALESNGHYSVLGYAENNDQLWWQLDTDNRQAWVRQDSVLTKGSCSILDVVDIPALATTTQDTSSAAVSFVPTTQSVWQADSGADVLTGDCANSAPLAVCSHMAAIIPQADGSIQWRGQEPIPFPMQNTGLNTYYYQGRNFQNNGNLTLNLTFVSPSQWNLTYATVYDDAPACTHTFYYTGVPR
jgi:uncharacterized protein YraI